MKRITSCERGAQLSPYTIAAKQRIAMEAANIHCVYMGNCDMAHSFIRTLPADL